MDLKSASRAKAGTVVSLIGIFLNVLLAAAKISVGLIFGLISVAADGFNNLSDCGSSAVALVSFRISEKPADKEHPYGHRRAEYVASMIIGFFVLLLAVELFRESIAKIIENALFDGTYWVFLVLGLSIVIKAGMFVLYRIASKKLNSDTLRAAATDSLCDCVATTAVLVGAIIAPHIGISVDGWLGIAVALFIAVQGIRLLAEMSSKLLGQAPDKSLVEGINAYLSSEKDVLGVHDLRVYMYGRDKYFATAHVEMDAGLPALAAHAVLDGLEKGVEERFGILLTAHLDPVDLNDVEARELKAKIKAATQGIAEGLELHDFRIIRGAATKVVFDAGVPYSCKKSNDRIIAELSDAVFTECGYRAVITVDRE